MKINKNTIEIFIAAVIIILAAVFLIKSNEKKVIVCQNKEYKIPVTLQSGEQGRVYITDNRCELPNIHQQKLSFAVLPDGAIQDNLYESKLYIWTRNSQSIQGQLQSILKKQFKKDSCQIEKDKFTQYDGLETYHIKCSLFGSATDYSSESFMEANGLLIAQRQDGMDGISPYNLASIKFVKE